MSKYLRTFFLTLLVLALAVSCATATTVYDATGLFWVNNSSIKVSPTGANLIDTSDSSAIECPEEYIFDPTSTGLGEILEDLFFNAQFSSGDVTSPDAYDLVKLGGYGFNLTGEGVLPKPFITYDPHTHIRYVPEEFYDVTWNLTVSPAFDFTYKIDKKKGNITISGNYPNVTADTKYTFKLTGKVALTTEGAKYFTLDQITDRKLLDVAWTADVIVTPETRKNFGPTSNQGKSLIKQTKGTTLGLNVISADGTYSVKISADNSSSRYKDPGATYGGTTYVQYNVELHPWSYSKYYVRIGEPVDFPAEDVLDGDTTYDDGTGTWTVTWTEGTDDDGNTTYVPTPTAYVDANGTKYYIYKETTTDDDTGDTTTTYQAENRLYVDFNPASVDFETDPDNPTYKPGDGLTYTVTYPATAATNPDNRAHIRGYEIAVTSTDYDFDGDGDAEGIDSPLYKEPYVYDGFYIPQGLKLTMYDSEGAVVGTPLTYGSKNLTKPYPDPDEEFDVTAISYYVLEYDEDSAPAAGTVGTVIIPFGVVLYDAISPVADEIGRPFPEKYFISWDVLFSGDVEEESSSSTTDDTPTVAVSGDVTKTAAVGEEVTFTISGDATHWVISPDVSGATIASYDSYAVVSVSPTAAGTTTVNVVAYNSDPTKSATATLTVVTPEAATLEASFTRSSLTVAEGGSASADLVCNNVTGTLSHDVTPSTGVTVTPLLTDGTTRSLRFVFTPAATQTYRVHVSDDVASRDVSITVTVSTTPTPTPTTPAAPVVTGSVTETVFTTALESYVSSTVELTAPSGQTAASWTAKCSYTGTGTPDLETAMVLVDNGTTASITVDPESLPAGAYTISATYTNTAGTVSAAKTIAFTLEEVTYSGGGSSGGCDAGFGALALAALFLLKKRS